MIEKGYIILYNKDMKIEDKKEILKKNYFIHKNQI